jgi:two-component system phosphate regulon sensor histidine kinase PhoR
VTKKIFRDILLVALIALITAGSLILVVVYNQIRDQVYKELKQETEYVAKALMQPDDQTAYLESLTRLDTRITWIGSDGTVLYDNTADAAVMENHKNRPEVIEAVSKGTGQSERYSATLSEVTLYYAFLLNDGTVIRLSQTRQSVWGLLIDMLPAFILIIVIAIIISSIMATRFAKRIIHPINELNLEEPEKNDIYPELSPLLLRISKQKERISNQIEQLAQQQHELGEITRNMKEGLIILNRESKVLAINESAIKLFGMPSKVYLGRNVLELNRSLPFQMAVDEARKGEKTEHILEQDGSYYQIIGTPVMENGVLTGIMILIVDVTERQKAEKMRREFSANVSHELKTPLSSIIGYAEIIKNGVARPEDIKGFASRIYDESKRLIALVEDIIKLSRLDEGDDDIIREPVDLFEVANDIKKRLDSLVKSRKVSISVEGKGATVSGAKQILEEMVYNLCENAVKYNRKNGSVNVTVKKEKGQPVLIVSDTGLGIPPADQAKVFERFYRVEKSHSKETGGTGLGLSIVKHAALFHNAAIELESKEDEGTRIEIRFPKYDPQADLRR